MRRAAECCTRVWGWSRALHQGRDGDRAGGQMRDRHLCTTGMDGGHGTRRLRRTGLVLGWGLAYLELGQGWCMQ